MIDRRIATFVFVALSFSTTASGQFEAPRPEVFVRPEDQKRARLLDRPCTEADVGHGCYRYDNRLIRDYPCTYRIDTNVMGSLPTDQCFRMEPPQRYRGIWIDEFEGQQFVPEGQTVPDWPRGDVRSAKGREAFDRARAATIWLDVDHADVGHDWRNGGRRMFVEFIGRKTAYPGSYGHMGMSGHELIIDRMISMRECPREGVCR